MAADKYEDLIWTTHSTQTLLTTPVFTVVGQEESAKNGAAGTYVAIEAPDWIVTVAVENDRFVLVRQWRHGEDRITLEFPGGIAEPGEPLEQAAARELLEETGRKAGRITRLGRVSANPALFKNHIEIFLAEDLVDTGELHTDEDELLRVETMPIDEVIARFGEGEMTHAYMGTALALYLRHKAGGAC
ncbi:MAG: NUDIX hydrolase [Lachnospiraceae bacterium]|nr:NUDIX hydrolase [Lachnospiraceae bacterium]